MSPITHPLADTFLLGLIVGLSAVATLFFLRFWKETHDVLFLGFAAFFLVEGGSEAADLTFSRPNVGSIWLFLARLFAALAVIAAILWKNAQSH